jgi:predicted small lipoprotein YifL
LNHRDGAHSILSWAAHSLLRNLQPIALGLFIAALAGCGAESPPLEKPSSTASAPPTESDWRVKEYKSEELTATGDEFPIDEGRVEVAPPVEWNRLPRSDKYLVCFTRSDRTGLPRITATAEPFASAVFTKITADNLVEFAKFRQEALTGGDEPVELVESVRPLKLGDNYWIRYVRPASFRSAAAERQILETVNEGRLFVVELQVVAGTLRDHRDAGYAVAARWRFVDPSAPPPAEEPTTEPPPATDPPVSPGNAP